MTERVTITEGWPDTATVTASGATDVFITNTSGTNLFYAVRDTKPDFDVGQGHVIAPAWAFSDNQQGPSLKDGEKLWLASAKGSFDVTMTTGAA